MALHLDERTRAEGESIRAVFVVNVKGLRSKVPRPGLGGQLPYILLGSLSGGALAGAFEPIAAGWLAIPALATLFLALKTCPRRSSWVIGVAFGLAFMGPLLWWLQESRGTAAWMSLTIIQTAWLTSASVLVSALAKERLWAVWAPASWIAVEELRSTFPFGGFPWGQLGHSAIDTPWAGLLPYVGVWGTGFLIALVAALSAWTFTAVRPSDRRSLAARILVTAAGVGASLLPHAFPYSSAVSGLVNVGIVQGGVPDTGTDVAANSAEITRRHASASLDLAADVNTGELAAPDFVVWPESSSSVDPRNNPAIATTIQDSVEALGVPLLMGQITDAADNRFIYNQGVVRLPATQHTPTLVPQPYTKTHPVPFGEYIPFRPLLAGLSAQLDRIPRDMLAGTDSNPLDIAGIAVADAICFDVAYSDVIEPQVRNGAQIAVVQTSNASFSGTAQLAQQFAISRVRALTTGRSLIVSSLNGISGAINSDGTVATTLPTRDISYTVAAMPLHSGVTPYIRWQTWIDSAPVALSAIGLLLLALRARTRTQMSARKTRRQRTSGCPLPSVASSPHRDHAV